jgi:hypothetical protein
VATAILADRIKARIVPNKLLLFISLFHLLSKESTSTATSSALNVCAYSF